MTCICGHSDDLHVPNDQGECIACECDGFCEDIDRDELEVE